MSAPKKTVKVTQIRSVNRDTKDKAATLKGLGLRGLHSTSVLEDTPAVRGMIRKMAHVLKIEG